MEQTKIFKQFYDIARNKFKSDKQLAEALGIRRSSFSIYTKKNNPSSPSIKTLENWCEILEIKIVEDVFNN